MNRERQALAPDLIVFSFVTLTCLLFLVPLRADAQRTMTPGERMRERQVRREAQMETNLMIEALKTDSRRAKKEEKRPNLAGLQLQQDFEQLQTVHNRMMVMTFANKSLDYNLISEASEEIKRRATRLKSGLPLPKPDEGKAKEESLKGWDELDQGQVKPALLALDDLVMRFVTNPVFQKSEVINLQQSSQATRDLEAIIKLSGKIKKSANKLTKASR
jgi:hypothetical protein